MLINLFPLRILANKKDLTDSNILYHNAGMFLSNSFNSDRTKYYLIKFPDVLQHKINYQEEYVLVI